MRVGGAWAVRGEGPVGMEPGEGKKGGWRGLYGLDERAGSRALGLSGVLASASGDCAGLGSVHSSG